PSVPWSRRGQGGRGDRRSDQEIRKAARDRSVSAVAALVMIVHPVFVIVLKTIDRVNDVVAHQAFVHATWSRRRRIDEIASAFRNQPFKSSCTVNDAGTPACTTTGGSNVRCFSTSRSLVKVKSAPLKVPCTRRLMPAKSGCAARNA